MINPEFKRNCWLKLSVHRLIAMPVVLGIIFLAIYFAGQSRDINKLGPFASVLFVAIVCLWGTRSATASVIDEYRDKTWDQQRMSALQPWTMSWGKLFGATIFNWIGGTICLVVYVAAGYADDFHGALISAATLIAVGVMMHAASIAINLHISRIEARIVQRGGIGWLVILLAGALFIYADQLGSTGVNWWGKIIEHGTFLLFTCACLALCAVFAAWRVMSNALQVRTVPWAWPLFACLLAAYFAGFNLFEKASAFFTGGLLISAGMTYAALFSEPNAIPVWERVIARMRAKNHLVMLEHIPLWTSTFILTFAFTIGAMFFSSDTSTAFIEPGMNALIHATPLVLALMLLRDVCIFLFFSFSINPKRVEATTLFYLVLLYGILPFGADVAGLEALRYFFRPFSNMEAGWSIGIAALHAAIALTLVIWRWRANAGREFVKG